jgi:hypothetical protein
MIGWSRPQLFCSVMTGTTLNCKPWTLHSTVYCICRMHPTHKMCVMLFSQQLASVYINCSNLLLFLIQMQNVLCEAKSELLHTLYMNFRFQHYMELSGKHYAQVLWGTEGQHALYPLDIRLGGPHRLHMYLFNETVSCYDCTALVIDGDSMEH